MRTPIPFLIPLVFIFSACSQKPPEISSNADIPLISAAESGDLTSLSQLLKSNQEVDARDSCQWTPLMKAALNGHLKAVRKLVDAGALINLTDKGGYSAMMLAASNNHSNIVRLLLEHDANVNQVESTNGWTALIWAAKQGHMETVRILLDHNANPELKDLQGKTAKDWAPEGQSQAIISLILKST